MNLDDELRTLHNDLPGFVSTDVVSIDSGLSIGGWSADRSFDASLVSATSAEIVKANRRSLDLLGYEADSTEDILITTRELYLLIRMLDQSYYHVLALSRTGNLGLARAVMRRMQPKLRSFVEELG